MKSPPIIIDIEASGFGIGSYPIEIGYANADGSAWCALVLPQQEWQHWDEAAEQLHQITRECLLAKGVSPSVIANHLNDVLLNQTVYSDGWINDYTWLYRLFDLADMNPHFKLADLRESLSPFQQSIWHHTKQTIIETYDVKRHRASTDAQLLQLTWIKTAAIEAKQLIIS